jgi:hypothetical protein
MVPMRDHLHTRRMTGRVKLLSGVCNLANPLSCRLSARIMGEVLLVRWLW